MDRLYKVSWPAKEIELHASKESDVVAVALEYIRTKNLISVKEKFGAGGEEQPERASL